MADSYGTLLADRAKSLQVTPDSFFIGVERRRKRLRAVGIATASALVLVGAARMSGWSGETTGSSSLAVHDVSAATDALRSSRRHANDDDDAPTSRRHDNDDNDDDGHHRDAIFFF